MTRYERGEPERLIEACEYQIDYWLGRAAVDPEALEATEMYARLRREYREELMLEPDELDRMFDE